MSSFGCDPFKSNAPPLSPCLGMLAVVEAVVEAEVCLDDNKSTLVEVVYDDAPDEETEEVHIIFVVIVPNEVRDLQGSHSVSKYTEDSLIVVYFS